MRRLAPLLLAALAGCTGSKGTAPAARPSVLLITIDTLRADRVGAYGDTVARTPNLDRLASAGVLFEAAYAAAPITLPSHATLMTGLLPPVHGVRGNVGFALGPGPRTLAEALRGRGLRTAAFVGAFPLARRFGLDRGFDGYDDAFERAPGLHFDFPERRADRVAQAALSWLATEKGPVFLWVHFYDPHAPYDPPPEFRGEDPYRGEIAFVDSVLGPLLTAWDGRSGPSLVVLASDHGEAFGEHGEESHGLFAYDTTLRVPLILRGPGVPAGRRVTSAVGLVDVAATIADLAGVAEKMPGASLRSWWSGSAGAAGPLYAETLAPRLDFGWSDLRVWRDGRYKLVRAPRPELFDVEADPAEARNLFSLDPERARRMTAALDSGLRDMGEGESRRAVDPETAESLRALGYVASPGGGGSGADPKDEVAVARRIAHANGPFRGPDDVVATYREIAGLDPENPVVNFRLADALLRAGHRGEAIPLFVKVVEGGPRTADAFVGLATAYAESGRLDDAERVLERARGVEPANGQVRYNLGEIARMRGDRAAAQAHYNAALADPVTKRRAQARLEALR